MACVVYSSASDGWWMMDGGLRTAVGECWMVTGGCWLVDLIIT